MRRLLLALAIGTACASPAYAYDPEAREERTTQASPTPSPSAPIQLPPGLYRVTDVYAGDVVTRSGDVTTYTTRTEHRVTDTYARVLETVATGARSAFDGRAFNGRTTLSDGTPVGGTYYQNYVQSGERFVPVSIVFFQDDSERARHAAATAPPTPMRTAGPAASTRPFPSTMPAPSSRPAPRRTPARSSSRRSIAVAIGLDPTGGTAMLDRLEVARGARYAFAVNVRGTPESVVLEAWQLLESVNDAANEPGWRAPQDRLHGLWSRLAPPAAAWPLAIRVRVRPASGGPSFEVLGRVSIVVRSPAVVE